MPGTINSTSAPQMIMNDMSPRSNLCRAISVPPWVVTDSWPGTHWLASAATADSVSGYRNVRHALAEVCSPKPGGWHSLDRSRRVMAAVLGWLHGEQKESANERKVAT